MDAWRDIAPYLGFAAALLLASGFFAGIEVALFALRRVDREQMARSERAADKIVLALLAQPRRLIATVQIGSEAVKALLAVIIVLAVARVVEAATPLTVGALAVAIALPVIVLFGEVTAKTLALKSPMAWARGAGRALYVFALLVSPVRWVIGGIAEVLLKPFGAAARTRPGTGLSEEEFRTLVDAGSAQGQVDARERRIIHRVFEFSDKNVGQVMTPRDKVVALSYDLPMSRLVKEVAAKGFSRIPIYQRSLDNIRGILNAKDLVPALAGQAPARTLSELLHEPLFVPRTTPIKRLFRTMKQKKVHLAIVVNEYGKVLGLVTMDDLMSQLFGAIRDEREGQQKAAARRGRGGRTPVPGTVPATPETGPVPLTDAADLREQTPLPDEGYADLTPPPVDPAAASQALRDLAELEDERTPPPVDTMDLPRDPAAPVPVTDVATGPSGPVKAARGRGEA
jgi:CBS domain containing-hemolysin-like protein